MIDRGLESVDGVRRLRGTMAADTTQTCLRMAEERAAHGEMTAASADSPRQAFWRRLLRSVWHFTRR